MSETISSNEFQTKVIQAGEPVLVDFFATWCGPCKTLAPVLEEVERDIQGRIPIYKIDIDKSPDLATHYSISSIPTLALFEHGEITDRIVGAKPKQDIESLVGRILSDR